MDYQDNRFLTVGANVILTPTIANVIFELEGWFGEDGLFCTVTSGLRTAEKQLSIIIDKSIQHGVDREFSSIKTATVKNISSWLNSWGRLLQIGEMVNPPLPTKAPYDYKKPNGDQRKAGTFIDISNHMKGGAFDIGKGAHTLQMITTVLDKALADPTIKDLKGYLPEPVNGCVHCDCIIPKLGNF